ncbi:hypothetical protein ES703_108116 [subsurface metagenome]
MHIEGLDAGVEVPCNVCGAVYEVILPSFDIFAKIKGYPALASPFITVSIALVEVETDVQVYIDWGEGAEVAGYNEAEVKIEELDDITQAVKETFGPGFTDSNGKVGFIDMRGYGGTVWQPLRNRHRITAGVPNLNGQTETQPLFLGQDDWCSPAERCYPYG